MGDELISRRVRILDETEDSDQSAAGPVPQEIVINRDLPEESKQSVPSAGDKHERCQSEDLLVPPADSPIDQKRMRKFAAPFPTAVPQDPRSPRLEVKAPIPAAAATPVVEEQKRSSSPSVKKQNVVQRKKVVAPVRVVPPAIHRLLAIYNESTEGENWSQVINERNVVIHKKTIEGSPVVLVKGVAILEGVPLRVMYEALADASIRTKWDNLMTNFEVIESLPEDSSEVIHFVIKAPFTVQDRDFVQRRTTIFDYPQRGQILMHFESIDHPLRPITSKYVRAHTTIAGYMFKEISTFPLKCSLSIVSQVDIKGYIPKSLVNMCAGRASRGWVESYKKGCVAYLAEMKAKKK